MKKTLLTTSSVVAIMACAASASAHNHKLSGIFFIPSEGQAVAGYDLSYNDLTYKASTTANQQYIATSQFGIQYGVNDRLTLGLSAAYNNASDNDSDGDSGGDDGWTNPVINLGYRLSETENNIFDITASYAADVVDEDSSDFVGDDDDFAGIYAPKSPSYSLGVRIGKNGDTKRGAVSIAYQYIEGYKLSGTDYSAENNLQIGYQSEYSISDQITVDGNIDYLVRDSRTRGATAVDGGDRLRVGFNVKYDVRDDLAVNVGLSRTEFQDTNNSSSSVNGAANTALTAGVRYSFQAM